MEDFFSPIPGAITIRESLPRPNWDVIAAWVDNHLQEAMLDETWTQIARDWLSRLSHSLRNSYALHESSNFLILAANARLAERVLHNSERARHTILDTLAGVASDQGFGKHVILLFADLDSYYDYVADSYPDEGAFALSGGMFFDVGYGHFAICPTAGEDYERVIAHELNHALLRHLPLPLWLNEGVTQVMEDVVLKSSRFTVDHETRRRHLNYWNGDTIHSFWSGESYYFPDDGQELSYHLSQVLFRNLMSDYPKMVKDILKSANFADAGNAAIINHCSVSLKNRASQFLGDGPWAPKSHYTIPDA